MKSDQDSLIVTLVTATQAAEKLCPFLDGPCRPHACMQWVNTARIHRDTGERLGACGISGLAGKWNPRAIASRDAPPYERPRSDASRAPASDRAPAHDPRPVAKNSVTVTPLKAPANNSEELL